jgi:hypothetical protein
MKRPASYISILLCPAILLSILLLPSCEKGSGDTRYRGTWINNDTIVADQISYITSRTLTLTDDSYTEVYVISRESTGSIIMVLGLKGGLSVKNNRLTFKLKELGTCVRDVAERCTGDVEWYGSDTSYYTENIDFFRLTVEGEYEVEGESLLITRDMNGDGDNEDTGEDLVFTRI